MDVPLGHHVEKKGQAAVGDVAADQKTPRPFPGKTVVVFAGVEIGQFEIGPVVQTRPLGPFAGRQAAQAFLGRLCAIAEAVPAMDCCLPQEWKTRLEATPRT